MALSSYRRGCSGLSTLIVFSLLLFIILHLSVRTVNAQALKANQALSSPSHINALKKSAIWLHWNYTFNSAGSFFTFTKQECSMNDTVSSTVTLIAQKIGENGPLQVESVLPNALVNRVIAFANNNTLMIKDLEYNDTARQFKSVVLLKVAGSATVIVAPLQPIISITVTGVPGFLSAPASTMEVAEGGNLVIVPRFDGNPKPSAQFQWSHQTSKTTLFGVQEYPYMYRATYSFNPISASYCGRVINIRLVNNIGTSADKSTTVTVLLNLDASPNLRAGKPNQSCVEVIWQKKESGLCQVTYTVKLKNSCGVVLYQESGINIAKIVKCSIPSNVDITIVELTMASTNRIKLFSAVVQQSQTTLAPTTLAPTMKTESTTTTAQSTAFPGSVKPTDHKSSTVPIYIGLSATIVIMAMVNIVLVIWILKLRRNSSAANVNDTDEEKKNGTCTTDKHYRDLRRKDIEMESNYAALEQSQYIEPSAPSTIYENTSGHLKGSKSNPARL